MISYLNGLRPPFRPTSRSQPGPARPRPPCSRALAAPTRPAASARARRVDAARRCRRTGGASTGPTSLPTPQVDTAPASLHPTRLQSPFPPLSPAAATEPWRTLAPPLAVVAPPPPHAPTSASPINSSRPQPRLVFPHLVLTPIPSLEQR
jgi:hypothetical protein